MSIKPGDMVKLVPLYLEFIGGNSKKFWEIGWISESTFATCWGRIGSHGQKSERVFTDKYSAKREYENILSSKLKKGYQVRHRPEDRPDVFPISEDFNLVTGVTFSGNTATILTPTGELTQISTKNLQVIMAKADRD